MKKDTPYLIDWIWMYFFHCEKNYVVCVREWRFDSSPITMVTYNMINMVTEKSVSLLLNLYSVAHCDAFSVRVAEDDDV